LFKDYRMTFYIPIERSASWRGYTFIAPTVSVGNVGQLTVDLLVSTLNMKKVGLINDPALTPVIGNDPYAHSLSSRVGTLDLNQQHDGSSSSPCLMTGCEVYESSFHRLVVMQLRSPLIPGRQSAFLRRLLAFIREKELASTLFLSSCHAHERLDAQLSGDQFRYLATAAFCPRLPPATAALWSGTNKDRDCAASTDWIPLERRARGRDEGAEVDPFLPGGGLARRAFVLCEAEGVAAAVLLVFCSEGDNVPEALVLANRVNQLLEVVDETKPRWRIPGSWSALFGNQAQENQLVFG